MRVNTSLSLCWKLYSSAKPSGAVFVFVGSFDYSISSAMGSTQNFYFFFSLVWWFVFLEFSPFLVGYFMCYETIYNILLKSLFIFKRSIIIFPPWFLMLVEYAISQEVYNCPSAFSSSLCSIIQSELGTF